MSWNNTEPKSTRVNLERLAKVKKMQNIILCLSLQFPTIQVEMASYLVSLSVIRVLQQNYQGF